MKCVTLCRVVIWSLLINPAMDCARDERISGESHRSSTYCDSKSEMGTISNGVARFSKCVAECNFNCRNVRVYRGGPGAGTILAIFTAYVRAAGKIAGARNEFSGPMAKQHRMLIITIACLYSVMVPRSWQIFYFGDLEIGVMALALSVIISGCLVTVARRLQRITQALR